MNYVGNVAYLLARLYIGVEQNLKEETFVIQLEALYSSMFLILIKIFLPTYLAAKLNERALAGLKIVHGWDSSVGTPAFKDKLLLVSRNQIFVGTMSQLTYY